MEQTLRHFLGLGMGFLSVTREAAPAGSGLLASAMRTGNGVRVPLIVRAVTCGAGGRSVGGRAPLGHGLAAAALAHALTVKNVGDWVNSGTLSEPQIDFLIRKQKETARLIVDSTIVRAHQHSAGAQKKRAVRKSAVRAAD